MNSYDFPFNNEAYDKEIEQKIHTYVSSQHLLLY